MFINCAYFGFPTCITSFKPTLQSFSRLLLPPVKWAARHSCAGLRPDVGLPLADWTRSPLLAGSPTESTTACCHGLICVRRRCLSCAPRWAARRAIWITYVRSSQGLSGAGLILAKPSSMTAARRTSSLMYRPWASERVRMRDCPPLTFCLLLNSFIVCFNWRKGWVANCL